MSEMEFAKVEVRKFEANSSRVFIKMGKKKGRVNETGTAVKKATSSRSARKEFRINPHTNQLIAPATSHIKKRRIAVENLRNADEDEDEIGDAIGVSTTSNEETEAVDMIEGMNDAAAEAFEAEIENHQGNHQENDLGVQNHNEVDDDDDEEFEEDPRSKLLLLFEIQYSYFLIILVLTPIMAKFMIKSILTSDRSFKFLFRNFCRPGMSTEQLVVTVWFLRKLVKFIFKFDQVLGQDAILVFQQDFAGLQAALQSKVRKLKKRISTYTNSFFRTLSLLRPSKSTRLATMFSSLSPTGQITCNKYIPKKYQLLNADNLGILASLFIAFGVSKLFQGTCSEEIKDMIHNLVGPGITMKSVKVYLNNFSVAWILATSKATISNVGVSQGRGAGYHKIFGEALDIVNGNPHSWIIQQDNDVVILPCVGLLRSLRLDPVKRRLLQDNNQGQAGDVDWNFDLQD
jgi:hypothetical protein